MRASCCGGPASIQAMTVGIAPASAYGTPTAAESWLLTRAQLSIRMLMHFLAAVISTWSLPVADMMSLSSNSGSPLSIPAVDCR